MYVNNEEISKMLRKKLITEMLEDQEKLLEYRETKDKFPAMVVSESYISYGASLLISEKTGGGFNKPNNYAEAFLFGCPTRGWFSHMSALSLN